MFAWLRLRRFTRERQRLEHLHLQLLEQARDLQRGGDIRAFAAKPDVAATVERQLDDWIAREKAQRAVNSG